MDDSKSGRSDARQFRDQLKSKHEEEMELIKHLKKVLLKMQDFSSSKKNIFLPIREGIQKAFFTVQGPLSNIAVGEADVDIF